jgi:hypothetical protein
VLLGPQRVLHEATEAGPLYKHQACEACWICTLRVLWGRPWDSRRFFHGKVHADPAVLTHVTTNSCSVEAHGGGNCRPAVARMGGCDRVPGGVAVHSLTKRAGGALKDGAWSLHTI